MVTRAPRPLVFPIVAEGPGRLLMAMAGDRKGKRRGAGPAPGKTDATRFAQYPVYANAGALLACLTMMPEIASAGDVVPWERLSAATMLFAIGLLAALWSGYSGKVLKLAEGSTLAGLNFIVPLLISSILFFVGALFGLALLWRALV